MYFMRKDDTYFAYWEIPENTYFTLTNNGYEIITVDGIDHGTAQIIMNQTQEDLKTIWENLEKIMNGVPETETVLGNNDKITIRRKNIK
jgi:hypothetical protein